MAMVGGTLTALVIGRNDPGFIHNGPLAGLVAVCAGSDLMHPLGALATGAIAGALFVWMFMVTQNKWKIDDVLGVWPLHGLCGAWGGIAAGIFGAKALGGIGGVSLAAATDRHTGWRGRRYARQPGGVWLVEARSWACGWMRKPNSTVPTSASTRCRQPPNAKPTGSLVFPVFLQLLQVLAAFDAQLLELPIDLHHVGMLLGVGQQQLGSLDA